MNAFFARPATAFAAMVAFSATVWGLAAMWGSSASAQSPPACDAASLGTTACLASKMCACTYERGGLATGVPAGYRWDCGILRPGCSSSFTQPATLNPYVGPYPTAVGIDRSHRNITIEQRNTGTKANTKGNSKGVFRPRTPAQPAWTGDPLPLLPPD